MSAQVKLRPVVPIVIPVSPMPAMEQKEQVVGDLTVGDIMRRFGISRRTLYSWRRKRGLPVVLLRGDKVVNVRFNSKQIKVWAHANRLGHRVSDL